jgi:hypothetical protein
MSTPRTPDIGNYGDSRHGFIARQLGFMLPMRLYLHSLDDLTTVRKLVAFYVAAHNEMMPHHAFQGQTPDEMYFARGAHVPDELAARRQAARQQRVATNRSAACAACPRVASTRADEVAA